MTSKRGIATRIRAFGQSVQDTLFGVGRGVGQLFDAAAMVGRVLSWNPPSTEVNQDVVNDGVVMRNRARKLIANNPWAKSALNTFVANAVGTGPIPRPKHPDDVKRKMMIDLFDRWSRVCSPNRKLDFYAMCSLAVRACKSDGEVFGRLRYRYPTDNLPVGLQVQVLEADFCPLDKEIWYSDDPKAAYDPYVRYGMQFSPIGEVLAYFLYKQHPAGRQFNATEESLSAVRTPAAEVVHMLDIERPGQERGYPWMTPVTLSLYDLKQLSDASLLRQKVANLLSIWIRRGQNGNSGIVGEKQDPAKAAGQGYTTLSPGTVSYIDNSESIEFLNPNDAGNGFTPFMNFLLRSIARGLGLTFEQLTGDLTNVNFASSRAGMLEFRRGMEAWQHHTMIHQWCIPIWNAFISQAVLERKLWPGAELEYFEHPEYFEADWQPMAWPWIDPVKDQNAARDRVRSGFSTRAKECASLGEDAEAIDKVNARENERADDLGLIYDSDGRVGIGAGTQPTEETETNEDTPPAEDRTNAG